MGRRIHVGSAALAALVLALAPEVAAQTYRWTDDGGHVHYTQGLGSVPDRYRPDARLVGFPESPAPAAAVAGPAPAADRSVARIAFTPGRPIMVTARINGGGSADLMLDTGATVTLINPRVLAALGVGMRDAQRGSIQGVTGRADVLAVTLESLEVAGARVGPIRVVSHDGGPGSGDGLLGRDFLDRFTVTIDNAAGLVTLTPR